MNDDLRRKLAEPFPPDKVKQKRGQGNRMMDYISHGLVCERLNQADPGWSSRVLAEHTYTDASGRLHCEGVTIELTVGGVSRVEAGGPTRQDGFANEIKNAYSDALKRAAMRFGVALSMWESLVDADGDEDAYPDMPPTRVERPRERRNAPPQTPQAAPRPPAPTPAASSPNGAAATTDDGAEDVGAYSWTAFWSAAREAGLRDWPTIDQRIGEDARARQYSPAQVRDRLRECGVTL